MLDTTNNEGATLLWSGNQDHEVISTLEITQTSLHAEKHSSLLASGNTGHKLWLAVHIKIKSALAVKQTHTLSFVHPLSIIVFLNKQTDITYFFTISPKPSPVENHHYFQNKYIIMYCTD